ncbi:metal-dependent transcriptional regulator [Nitrospinota bacterium]
MPSPHSKRPSDLSPSLEHYLRSIYDLQEEKGYARVTDIAEKLGVAKPAVSTALKTLRSAGLVDHRVYESVLLTDEGMDRAKSVSGKYAILLLFLTEILGVRQEEAFVDACLMEHYVSGNSLDRFLDLLRFFEDRDQQEVLEAFRAFRRSCESEATCPTCSFHCDVSVLPPGSVSRGMN